MRSLNINFKLSNSLDFQPQTGDLYPYDCAVMQNNTEVADYLRQNNGRSIKEDQQAKELQKAAMTQRGPDTTRSKKGDKRESEVQTVDNKQSRTNTESQTSSKRTSRREEGSEVGVQTTARRRGSSSADERDHSPRRSHRYRRSPKKSSNRDSESGANSDSGNGESDDDRKKRRRHHRRHESNYVSPYKYYPGKGDNRKVVNLNAHRHVIREQVAVALWYSL